MLAVARVAPELQRITSACGGRRSAGRASFAAAAVEEAAAIEAAQYWRCVSTVLYKQRVADCRTLVVGSQTPLLDARRLEAPMLAGEPRCAL